MEGSIYDYILEHTTDGILEEGFRLPNEEEGVGFADGAKDGIDVRCFGLQKMNAAAAKQMVKAVKAVAEDHPADADVLFAELGKNIPAIAAVDELQKYIVKNQKRIPAANVYNCALNLVLHSKHKESVKFGLELLELLEIGDDRTRNTVRKIGLCNEFTVFAVWVMRKWEDRNDEIFRLIQNVYGWGRIHALEELEPETEEIQKWILYNGIRNNIHSSYSALTAWVKSGAEEMLDRDMTEEEFSAVSAILDALFEEEAATGISGLEDPESCVIKWLELLGQYELSIGSYELVLTIAQWASKVDGRHEIERSCLDILSDEACSETVMKAIKRGEGFRIAEALDLDFRREAYEALVSDHDKNCSLISYLTVDDELHEKALKLLREKLPIDMMCRWPEDAEGTDDLNAYFQFDCALKSLSGKCFWGLDMVRAALHSPVEINRMSALQTIGSWCLAEDKTLSELDADLYLAVDVMYQAETDEQLKDTAKKLLDGDYTVEEEENEG